MQLKYTGRSELRTFFKALAFLITPALQGNFKVIANGCIIETPNIFRALRVADWCRRVLYVFIDRSMMDTHGRYLCIFFLHNKSGHDIWPRVYVQANSPLSLSLPLQEDVGIVVGVTEQIEYVLPDLIKICRI